ncbi:MAG TPA: tRNA (adenosine(37)-N6)-dimethylallyltransferase MiaA [Bacteroidales bacterium]
MLSSKYNLLTILGPTACGKTQLAVAAAAKLGSCVISADSRQVYKQMDIGTGKDLSEYSFEGSNVPHYLIDIRLPGEKYNVYEYQKDFFDIYEKVYSENTIPVLCGGSGLYIEAVLKNYQLLSVPVNEELRGSLKDKPLEELAAILATYKLMHNKSDLDTVKRAIRAIEIAEYQKNHISDNPNRPEINSLIIGIDFEREIVRKRITERLQQRLKEGMIDEVKALLNKGLASEDLIYYGLEYKYITLYLIGQLTYDEMVTQLNIAIHQFSKRQMTWFRKMERSGFKIHWVDGRFDMNKKLNFIFEKLYQSL